MALKTLEQERAAFAFSKIESVKQSSGNKDYRSLVRGFSSMILLNGLGQALAFLKAKGKNKNDNHHEILYQHINLWLKEYFGIEEDFNILEKIRNEDSYQYRLYTKETLAFLVWLKKFAEAELPD